MLVAKPVDLRGSCVDIMELSISSVIEDRGKFHSDGSLYPEEISIGGQSDLMSLFDKFSQSIFISKRGYRILMRRGPLNAKGCYVKWSDGATGKIWNNPWDSDIGAKFPVPRTVKEFIEELSYLDPSLIVKVVVSEGYISSPECRIEDRQLVIGELS